MDYKRNPILCMNGMLTFFLVYGFTKLVKTMIAGTVLMLIALLVSRFNRRGSSYINIVFLLVLICGLFTGYSKLFYTGRMLYVNNWLFQWVKPIYGGFYFGITALLFMVYLFRKLRMRSRISHMEKLYFDCPNSLLQDIAGMKMKYLKRVRLYICEERISPFSWGVTNPVIVIPRYIYENLRQEELNIILKHELLHISSGHLLMLNIYSLLKIIWWVNPLVYLCDRELRSSLEYACDGDCILVSGTDAYSYGNLILKTAYLRSGCEYRDAGPVASFSEKHFSGLRRRIVRLEQTKHVNEECADNEIECKRIYRIRHNIFVVSLLTIICGVLLIICITSYPRYTVLDEIYVYDENLNPVDYDVRQQNPTIRVIGDSIEIDGESLNKIVEQYALTGDYVLFSYGTIMKVPGVGGGGQVALVSLDDASDISYLGANTWKDKLNVFIMKYIL